MHVKGSRGEERTIQRAQVSVSTEPSRYTISTTMFEQNVLEKECQAGFAGDRPRDGQSSQEDKVSAQAGWYTIFTNYFEQKESRTAQASSV